MESGSVEAQGAKPEKDRGTALAMALTDGNDAQRRKALDLLLRPIGPGADDPLRDLLRMQRRLLGAGRERLQRVLREVAQYLVPAVSQRLATWQGTDLHLLVELAGALQRPEMVAALKPLLATKDRWAALFAIQAIAASGGADAVAVLTEALGRDDLRWAAIAELGERRVLPAMAAVARSMNDPSPEVRLEVVRAFLSFGDKRLIQYLARMVAQDPDERVRCRAQQALTRLASVHGVAVDDAELRAQAAGSIQLDRPLDRLLRDARLQGASDVHLVPGAPPAFRVHGEMVELKAPPLSPADVESLLADVMPAAGAPDGIQEMEYDLSYVVPFVGRHRVNIFRERRGLASVIRLIPLQAPGLAQLGLPAQVRSIVSLQQGLVIVTGRSGSGKSTTQAALVDLINEARPVHIVTLEDPIEYLHERKRGLVNQREIGRHSKSFAHALRAALREDPDVMVVGEMRDLVTMRMAVEAAETGHLVIATLHTPTAVGAIQRLIESFPSAEQQQVRLMLADSLRMVIAQMLVRRATEPGRVGAFELLLCTPAIGAMIRENKLNQVQAVLQTGRAEGMKTMDAALLELVEARQILPEDAFARAENKDAFRAYLKDAPGNG